MDVIRVLVSSGNVNVDEGRANVPPLYIAAQEGMNTVIEVLLEAGADPNLAKVSLRFFLEVQEATRTLANGVTKRKEWSN